MSPFLLIIAWSAPRDFHRSHEISFDHNILNKGSQDGQDGIIGFALKSCRFQINLVLRWLPWPEAVKQCIWPQCNPPGNVGLDFLCFCSSA